MRNRNIPIIFAILAWLAGSFPAVMAAHSFSHRTLQDQVALARTGDRAALNALQAAANTGSAVAQAALGDLYGYGQGVPTDYAKAIYWNRKAAEQGNAEAEFNLGTAYASGLSVPVDYIKACALMNLAVTQDSTYQKFRLKLIMSEMNVDQFAAARALSRRMMRVGVLEALDAH